MKDNLDVRGKSVGSGTVWWVVTSKDPTQPSLGDFDLSDITDCMCLPRESLVRDTRSSFDAVPPIDDRVYHRVELRIERTEFVPVSHGDRAVSAFQYSSGTLGVRHVREPCSHLARCDGIVCDDVHPGLPLIGAVGV